MSNLEDHLAEQDAITAASEAASVDFTWSAAAFAIMARTAQANDDNARRAARALLTFFPAYDDDTPKVGMQDLLTDLAHLCDLVGWRFADIASAAQTAYDRERKECGLAVDADLKAALQREE